MSEGTRRTPSEIVQAILEVVEAWRPYWPVTFGQVRHEMMRRGTLGASPTDFDGLCIFIMGAVQKGVLPYDAFVGRSLGFIVSRPPGFVVGRPGEPLRGDRQAGQERYVGLAVAHSDLGGHLSAVADQFGASIVSLAPDMVTANHAHWAICAEAEALTLASGGEPITIIAIDDFDVESGRPIVAPLLDDYALAASRAGVDVRIVHAAITPEMAARLAGQETRATLSGGRAFDVISAEALTPAELNQAVASAFRSEMDLTKLHAVVASETVGQPDKYRLPRWVKEALGLRNHIDLDDVDFTGATRQ